MGMVPWKITTSAHAAETLPQVHVLVPGEGPVTIQADNMHHLIYGSGGNDQVIIEKGAVARLLHFPGNNTITINTHAATSMISRSGAMVTIRDHEGTIVRLPATLNPQNLVFADGSRQLQIQNNSIMLNDRKIYYSGPLSTDTDRIRFPHYQEADGRVLDEIEDEYTTWEGQIKPEIDFDTLEINGGEKYGRVAWYTETRKENLDVYKLVLTKEGVVTVLFNPGNYDDTWGTLRTYIYFCDNRFEPEHAIRYSQGYYHKRKNGWWMVDSTSFYGYPGTYYICVSGYSTRAPDYIPLDYSLHAIQDENVSRISGFTVDTANDYYPNHLGQFELTDTIEITQSLEVKDYRKKSRDAVYVDEDSGGRIFQIAFKFTVPVDGQISFSVSPFTTPAIQIWQNAYLAINESRRKFLGKARVTVTAPSGSTVYSNSELTAAQGVQRFAVKAGKVYRMDIRSKGYIPTHLTLKMADPDHAIH